MTLWRIGTKVRIAKGIYAQMSGRIVRIVLLSGIRIPVIRLENGMELSGFECWWVTERVHQETVARLRKNRPARKRKTK